MVKQNPKVTSAVVLSFEEKLAKRNELYSLLGKVQADVASAERALKGKKRVAIAAGRALDNFKGHLAEEHHGMRMKVNMNTPPAAGRCYEMTAQFREDFLTPAEKAQFQAFSEKAAAAALELPSATKLLDSLKEKVLPVLDEISKLGDPLEEVLAFQEAVVSAQQKVAFLTEAITGQEAIIRKINADLPSQGDLLRKRQDILAEIAIGSATQGDLEELDKQIAKEQEKISKAQKVAAPAAEDAKHAIAGLQRKLAVACEEVKGLEGQRRDVVLNFLAFEAEKMGAEYAHLAGEFVCKFRQLLALNTIITTVDNRSEIFLGSSPFVLPTFDVQSCKGEIVKDWNFEGQDIVTEILYRGLGDSDLQAEKERITSLGVII